MRETDIIEHLRQQLPVAFGRTEVEKLLPGFISSKTLANLSSYGEGPPSYHHGRKVIYEKEDFLNWLSKRMKPASV
jgi:hypothetical protein